MNHAEKCARAVYGTPQVLTIGGVFETVTDLMDAQANLDMEAFKARSGHKGVHPTPQTSGGMSRLGDRNRVLVLTALSVKPMDGKEIAAECGYSCSGSAKDILVGLTQLGYITRYEPERGRGEFRPGKISTITDAGRAWLAEQSAEST